MSTVLVVSRSSLDDVFGYAGVLLRHINIGDVLHWLFLPEGEGMGWFAGSALKEEDVGLIERVALMNGVAAVHGLDCIRNKWTKHSYAERIEKISSVIIEIAPDVVYLPYRERSSDQCLPVNNAVVSLSRGQARLCAKTILAYETTFGDKNLQPLQWEHFSPNVFIDISDYWDAKIALLNDLGGVKDLSISSVEEAASSLANWRGASVGLWAAEAFSSIYEVV